MSEWLKLERLDANELPLPSFATKQAAGIDLAACLTRHCMLVVTQADYGPMGPRSNTLVCEAGQSNKLRFRCTNDGQRLLDGDNTDADCSEPQLIIQPNEVVLIPLGFKSEFDDRYVLTLYARSSVAIAGLMLANNTAVVDSDYRGEVFAPFWNRSHHPISVKHGQRIAQGVLIQFSRPIIKEIEQVNATQRGEGGFGSTGTQTAANVLSAANR
jgi:dUTP pyrophosphatase